MNDKDRIAFGSALLQIKCSLDTAVANAGGAVEVVCSLERLSAMTAFEFMCHLAENNVRFVHVTPNAEISPPRDAG